MCGDRKDVIEEEDDSDGQAPNSKFEKKNKKVIRRKVHMFSRYFQKEIVKLKIMFLIKEM